MGLSPCDGPALEQSWSYCWGSVPIKKQVDFPGVPSAAAAVHCWVAPALCWSPCSSGSKPEWPSCLFPPTWRNTARRSISEKRHAALAKSDAHNLARMCVTRGETWGWTAGWPGQRRWRWTSADRAARPPAAARPPTSASDAQVWGEGPADQTSLWPDCGGGKIKQNMAYVKVTYVWSPSVTNTLQKNKQKKVLAHFISCLLNQLSKLLDWIVCPAKKGAQFLFSINNIFLNSPTTY